MLAIRAEGLTKRYGDIVAADQIELSIPERRFFGLLGPNGAGKTTIIHMLSTLLPPSTGEAWVGGWHVRKQQLAVRALIGVVFQENALDRNLTVAENLRFAGRLNGLTTREISQRSDELLELFGLAPRRDDRVATLSGGMRRALDVARGMIHRPQILFLDEPTLGLDLPSRRAIWHHIAQIRASLGITVFLTTHYLEEAEDCDEVAFLNGGRIVRRGEPGAMISELGRYILEIETRHPAELARQLAARLGEPLIEADRLHFRWDRQSGEPGELAALQAELASLAGAVHCRRPNLNDVFLWINQAQPAQREAA